SRILFYAIISLMHLPDHRRPAHRLRSIWLAPSEVLLLLGLMAFRCLVKQRCPDFPPGLAPQRWLGRATSARPRQREEARDHLSDPGPLAILAIRTRRSQAEGEPRTEGTARVAGGDTLPAVRGGVSHGTLKYEWGRRLLRRFFTAASPSSPNRTGQGGGGLARDRLFSARPTQPVFHRVE